MKTLIGLCIVGNLLSVLANGNEHDFRLIDSIYQEADCSSQGGMCTVGADCPVDLQAAQGLCPEQRSTGVECCYGFSVKETRCLKRGGICRKGKNPCNLGPKYCGATDCPEKTTCCILVS